MSLQWADAQALNNVNAILNGLSYPLAVGLYTNNLTPDCSTALSAFTEVTGDSGYVRGQLTNSTVWSESEASCVIQETGPSLTFNFANSQTIYGYFVVDSGGNLQFSELLVGGPFTVGPTAPLILEPTLEFGNCS